MPHCEFVLCYTPVTHTKKKYIKSQYEPVTRVVRKRLLVDTDRSARITNVRRRAEIGQRDRQIVAHDGEVLARTREFNISPFPVHCGLTGSMESAIS